MRAACLARNLLVVDEVHASDTYMSAVLEALLGAHLDAGGYALLMSATLGSVARRRWLSVGTAGLGKAPPMNEAINAPYPAVSTIAPGGERVAAAGENNQEKTVGVEAAPEVQDFEAVAHRALTAARAGAKVLVVRNTVTYAINTQQAVEEAAAGGGPQPTVHLPGQVDAAPRTLRRRRSPAARRPSRDIVWQDSQIRRSRPWSARRRWSSHSTLTPTC